MSNLRTPILALGVALAMAAAAALPVHPILAFVAGGLGAALADTLLRRRARRTRAARPEAAAGTGEAPDAPEPSAAQALARAVVERLPSALLIIAGTGRIAYANPAAHRILPRLQPGVHFAALIRAPAFVEAVGATLRDHVERSFQFTTHQGRERFFEARVGLLPAAAAFGPGAQVFAQIEDRTEGQRAEQLRSDFIANASHELRTPLASIIGYIETLQNHARNDPEAREKFLAIMSREAARMQRLVDDLMSLSRIELNEHVRPVEQVSLNAVAAESASALAPVARAQGATLSIEIEPGGAFVRGDRDQLSQVFANLIDNALKYGGPGCVVRLHAAPPSKAHPNRFGVTIADDGPGIAREHVHRLTERFYRVNVSSSRTKGGTGLGLAIVKHIINRHEGRLEIASTPGKGSAFTIWLPGAAAGAGDAAGPPQAELRHA